MPFFRSLRASAALLLLLGACTPYLHQHLLTTQPARLGAETAANEQWRSLPPAKRKVVVAVYKFRDQTGQYKPQASGASFSTAVTQGATTILLRALEESQWFEPIERENLGNLLNERKIIRSTRQEFTEQTGQKQPALPPLLFAGILLEGGIISYDSNILTGGAGLRYFGAGASGQYRQDRVTVYLRAISTSTGKILKTIYTSKTILSQQVDASLFRFVDFKRLLETETGFTYNEPSEMAVKDAIEKSVQALIYEGFGDNLWSPRDTADAHGPGLQNYLREKAENLTIRDPRPTQSVVLLLTRATNATPPSAADRPTPAPGSTNQPVTLALSWHPVNATKDDSLRYDVILFESNNLNQRQLLTNRKDTTVTATGLLYNTTYYWQVTTRNLNGAATRGPIWSFQTAPLPDNRYLYARTAAGNTDIYSSDAAGANLLRLTSAATVETAPQLSPNRDLIAYASNANGQFQLYTMNRDGSNQRRITTLSAEGYNNAGVGYRWSPDGAQLIYAHYDQLYRINRDGTGLLLLATAPVGRHFRECDWTIQQGGRLVVQTMGVAPFDSEIYLYNVDGSNPVLLVSNLPGRVDAPSFSVDGSTVLFTHDVLGFNDAAGRPLDCHLFSQLITSPTAVDITLGAGTTGAGSKPAGTNDLTPRYSPTGFQIIFVNRDNDDIAPPEIWTCDLSGRNRTKLFSNAFWPDFK